MTFINDHKIIVREIIQQTERAGAGSSSVQVPRVVFYPGTIAQFADHFQIKIGAFFQTFCLQGFAYFSKKVNLFDQIILDLMNGVLQNVWRGNKHICGVDIQSLILLNDRIGNGVKSFYFLNFIPKKMYAKSGIGITGIYIHHIAFYPKVTMRKNSRCPRVKALHQLV